MRTICVLRHLSEYFDAIVDVCEHSKLSCRHSPTQLKPDSVIYLIVKYHLSRDVRMTVCTLSLLFLFPALYKRLYSFYIELSTKVLNPFIWSLITGLDSGHSAKLFCRLDSTHSHNMGAFFSIEMLCLVLRPYRDLSSPLKSLSQKASEITSSVSMKFHFSLFFAVSFVVNVSF